MAGSGGPWGGGGSGGDNRGDDKRGGDNRGGRKPGEGPQIPEIEEIVKKGQEQLRVLMGGKPRLPGGGRRRRRQWRRLRHRPDLHPSGLCPGCAGAGGALGVPVVLHRAPGRTLG